MRGAMKEVLLDVLPGMFREHEIRFDQKLDDLKMNLRDEIHSTVKASEAGLIRRMDALEQEMKEGFQTVLEVIDEGIDPQIQEQKKDIAFLKRYLKIA